MPHPNYFQGKAAGCAALQTLRDLDVHPNRAPAFGVRRIPPLLIEGRVDDAAKATRFAPPSLTGQGGKMKHQERPKSCIAVIPSRVWGLNRANSSSVRRPCLRMSAICQNAVERR